jgi:hypothetical protein
MLISLGRGTLTVGVGRMVVELTEEEGILKLMLLQCCNGL